MSQTKLHPASMRCLTLDAGKIAELTPREFDIARQELGLWGIPVEHIDEARRQAGPAPLASPLDQAIALAVAQHEVR